MSDWWSSLLGGNPADVLAGREWMLEGSPITPPPAAPQPPLVTRPPLPMTPPAGAQAATPPMPPAAVPPLQHGPDDPWEPMKMPPGAPARAGTPGMAMPPKTPPASPPPSAGPPMDIRPPAQQAGQQPAAQSGVGDRLMQTLKGIKAPEAPQAQKVTTPRPPEVAKLPTGQLLALLAQMGMAPQIGGRRG